MLKLNPVHLRTHEMVVYLLGNVPRAWVYAHQTPLKILQLSEFNTHGVDREVRQRGDVVIIETRDNIGMEFSEEVSPKVIKQLYQLGVPIGVGRVWCRRGSRHCARGSCPHDVATEGADALHHHSCRAY